MSARERIATLVRRNLDEAEPSRAAIAVSLALLTVLAAAVAGLQSQAAIEFQRSQREADRIGLEATGRDAAAIVQVGAAYGVYRRWFEEEQRATWAQTELSRNASPPNKTEPRDHPEGGHRHRGVGQGTDRAPQPALLRSQGRHQ